MAELVALLYGLVVLLCLAAAGRYVRRHGLSRVPSRTPLSSWG